MKVRKLLVTDIRCRLCDAPPGSECETNDIYGHTHGVRVAEFLELERAGWEWQEVDPTDRGARPRGGS